MGQATRFSENGLEVLHTRPAVAWPRTWLFCPTSDSSRASAGSSQADGLRRQLPGLPDSCGHLEMKAEKSLSLIILNPLLY